MKMTPLINVVVYREPGPEMAELEKHALEFVIHKSPWKPSGALGYVVLVAADFQRLWRDVAEGDAVGTAAGVLRCLGPSTNELIGRPGEYVYGWIGDEHAEHGQTLLLQVFPQVDAAHRSRVPVPTGRPRCRARNTRRRIDGQGWAG